MRTLPVINRKWATGGPFIDDLKPTTRVTVQMPWSDLVEEDNPRLFLRTTASTGVGSSTSRGVPVRWWQRADNSQEEMEIPNISSVAVDRSIDTDAASLNLVVENQWMHENGAAPANGTVLGMPGYFNL